jgi:hypothetical protein
MKESGSWAPAHSIKAIGRARRYTFEKGKDAPHSIGPIQRGNEVHLRSARVREADVYPTTDQSGHEIVGTSGADTYVFGVRPVHSARPSLICGVMIFRQKSVVHGNRTPFVFD